MIPAWLLQLLCKKFNVAHYSKILSYQYDKVQLLDKEHNSESNILELCPFLT